MHYLICAIMDKATEGYGRPFVARTENDALRVIQKEVNRNDPDNMLYTNTGDFSLWHVGNWKTKPEKLQDSANQDASSNVAP